MPQEDEKEDEKEDKPEFSLIDSLPNNLQQVSVFNLTNRRTFELENDKQYYLETVLSFGNNIIKRYLKIPVLKNNETIKTNLDNFESWKDFIRRLRSDISFEITKKPNNTELIVRRKGTNIGGQNLPNSRRNLRIILYQQQ